MSSIRQDLALEDLSGPIEGLDKTWARLRQLARRREGVRPDSRDL